MKLLINIILFLLTKRLHFGNFALDILGDLIDKELDKESSHNLFLEKVDQEFLCEQILLIFDNFDYSKNRSYTIGDDKIGIYVPNLKKYSEISITINNLLTLKTPEHEEIEIKIKNIDLYNKIKSILKDKHNHLKLFDSDEFI